MSTLKDALKTPSTKSTSSKNPTFYNREKNAFISDMATYPDEAVRIAVAGNEHVAASTLKQMLQTETDTDVLRVIIMNPRTPLKAIIQFTESPSAAAFEDDEEIETYLKGRVQIDES